MLPPLLKNAERCHLQVPSLDVPPEIVQSRLARETRVSAMNPCESWNIPLGYAHWNWENGGKKLGKKNKGVYYPFLSRNVDDLLTGIYHLCVLAYSRESDEELLRMLANTLDSSVWNTYFLPEAWTCNQPTLCGKYPKNGSPIPSFAVKRTIHLQPWDLWLGLPHYQCPHF